MPLSRVHTLLPGVALAALVAFLCILLDRVLDRIPVSAVTLAMIVGLLLGNIVRLPEFLGAGIAICVKKVLKLGIILLGFRLSLGRLLELGAVGIPVVVVCIVAGVTITLLLGRWLGLPRRLCTLIAVGTSICGVSAVVATAPAIGAREEETGYAVAVITIFGLLATLTYPYLSYFIFGGDQTGAGMFLGTAVHDTSQVTGAALIHADVYDHPKVLGVATVTKLVRNLFMVAVIPLVAFIHSRGQDSQPADGKKRRMLRLFPLFVLGFLTLCVLRSIGDATLGPSTRALGAFGPREWAGLAEGLKRWSVYLLVTALAGLGLSIRLSSLRGLGVKPFLAGLGAALAVGGVSLTAIVLLGKLIPAA